MNNGKKDQTAFMLELLDMVSVSRGKIPSEKFEILLGVRNERSTEENTTIAGLIQNLKIDGEWDDEKDYIQNAMFKSAMILMLNGYDQAARELFMARRMFNIERNNRCLAVDLSVKNKYREAASGPRNQNYNEIMAVIQATWEKYPAGSKKELIRKLMAHYQSKVSEDSIKRWIKESALQPPKPKKYERITLIFPTSK